MLQHMYNNVSVYKRVVYPLLGVLLLFLTAQISIPLRPVPITLQTVGVLIIGLTFTQRDAVYAVLTYLALGASGLPVFANYNAGWQVLVRPTGGYLIGFVLCVWAMTAVRNLRRQQSALTDIISCGLGQVIIYGCGVSWLAKFVGIQKALSLGLMPFILSGIAKTALLILMLRYLKRGNWFSSW